MKIVYLTGASGFIGKEIKKEIEKYKDKYILKTGKIYDVGNETIDILIHCASSTPENTMKNNEIAISNINMADYICKIIEKDKIKKIINLSSMSVYGQNIDGIINEKSKFADPSIYGCSKYIVEQMIIEACSKRSISNYHLRLPGVVGKNAKGIFMSKILENIKNNKSINLQNENSLFNNILHIDQLINFLLILMLKEGSKILNLASLKPIKIKEIVNYIYEEKKKEKKVKIIKNQRPSFIIDISEAIEYDFRAITTEESLKKYVEENK